MTSDTKVSIKTRALVCDAGRLQISHIPLASLCKQEILIDVRALGLCRTDLYAIAGKIPTYNRKFIPGHEFAGTVVATGLEVTELSRGNRVAINPVVGCGQCKDCKSSNAFLCSHAEFMGIDFDGACCDQVIVHQSSVCRFPDSLSFAEAAFAEPVAAALAILKADIRPEQSGLIVGDSRISELARRVLVAHKFKNITVADIEQAAKIKSNQFDFVIETDASSKMLAEMARLVRPRGVLILKSRQYHALEITPIKLIKKEPRLAFVNYGKFEDAIRLLVEQKVMVDDLIGKRFPLPKFKTALAVASGDEVKKTFLLPGN